MTTTDEAFKYAMRNCDAYENDEDPMCALRDGFLAGSNKEKARIRSYVTQRRKYLEDQIERYRKDANELAVKTFSFGVGIYIDLLLRIDKESEE